MRLVRHISLRVIIFKNQYPKIEVEKKEADREEYIFIVSSVMYDMMCIWPNIAFTVGMLVRYLQNPWIVHFRAAKKVLKYL